MKFSVNVRGDKHWWQFNFSGNKEHWQGWLDDGLIVYQNIGEFPEFIHERPYLTNLWLWYKTSNKYYLIIVILIIIGIIYGKHKRQSR